MLAILTFRNIRPTALYIGPADNPGIRKQKPAFTMKRVPIFLVLLPLGLWSIFVLPGLLAGDPGFWNWRRAVVLLSGILALWWMSAGIVLAARPRWLEQRLGGLDRLYQLHKTLGIGAGILVFAHWMSEWLPKNLAKAGLLPPRVRGPKSPPDFAVELAKHVGEWAFGISGYYLKQLTDDKFNGTTVPSIPGVISSGRKGQVFAFGPSVKYSAKNGSMFIAQWQHETMVENRFQGDKLWFKMILPL